MFGRIKKETRDAVELGYAMAQRAGKAEAEAFELGFQLDSLISRIKRVTQEYCACGGSGPDEGCDACRIYHDITQK